MPKLNQQEIPILEAVFRYLDEKPVRLHMPGHKGGPGADAALAKFWGWNVFQADLTEIPGLDDLHDPRGPIAKAQRLAAEAFGAQETFFLVNGATAGIQAAMLSLASPGQKILLPRYAHRSVFASLVISGLSPVYVQPGYHPELGIPLGISQESWLVALDNHPQTKLVLFVNPTYEGLVSVDAGLLDLVRKQALIIVDEAHGAHFSFHPRLPEATLGLGADLVIQGTHKLLGALTQGAMMHLGRRIEREKLQDALRLLETSSPSYLLVTSLDAARHQMACFGKKLMDELLEITGWARVEINKIKGFRCWGEELYAYSEIKGFDPTKLVIDGLDLGLTGFELASLLREQYRIQTEMAGYYYVLGLLTIGDGQESARRLVAALKDLADRRRPAAVKKLIPFPELKGAMLQNLPEQVVSPRESSYYQKRSLPLETASGSVCGELVVPYPPGIPLLCPGERITKEAVECLINLRKLPVDWQGLHDPSLKTIRILAD